MPKFVPGVSYLGSQERWDVESEGSSFTFQVTRHSLGTFSEWFCSCQGSIPLPSSNRNHTQCSHIKKAQSSIGIVLESGSSPDYSQPIEVC